MEGEEARLSLNMTLPRSLPEDIDPEPRSILEHNVTPLLKRATAQDLQVARDILKKALAESSKLNKARVAEPLRNNYGLRPGTDAVWPRPNMFRRLMPMSARGLKPGVPAGASKLVSLPPNRPISAPKPKSSV